MYVCNIINLFRASSHLNISMFVKIRYLIDICILDVCWTNVATGDLTFVCMLDKMFVYFVKMLLHWKQYVDKMFLTVIGDDDD